MKVVIPARWRGRRAITQQAVDRYLKDFHRVRTCYRHTPDRTFICQVTGMSAFLVDQYLTLIEKYEGNRLTGDIA